MKEIRDKKINLYKQELLKYNNKVNIISRNITEEQLDGLIKDSITLNKYIGQSTIIDMGSGNGILGIVIALINTNKKIILVESKEKKVNFLNFMVDKLEVKNTKIVKNDILNFIKGYKKENVSIITRGFTGKELYIRLFYNHRVREILNITSIGKINIIEKNMVNFKKNVYNVTNRDMLKIIKMENVSRETNN